MTDLSPPRPWQAFANIYSHPRTSRACVRIMEDETIEGSVPRSLKDTQIDFLCRLLDPRDSIDPRAEDSKVIVDLACGTGEHLASLTNQGWETRGIDVNPWALKKARRRALGQWICADLESPLGREQAFVGLAGNVHLLFMIYGTWCTLSPESRADLLEYVAEALAPGGVFVFDGFTYPCGNVNPVALEEQDSYWSEWGGFWGFFPTPVEEKHWYYPELSLRAEMYRVGRVEFCTWKQGLDPAAEAVKLQGRNDGFDDLAITTGSFGVELPPEEGGSWFTLQIRKQATQLSPQS